MSNIFKNLYWKKKYNTIVNEFEAYKMNHVKEKDQTIEIQEKYISILEKAIDYKLENKKLKKELNKKSL